MKAVKVTAKIDAVVHLELFLGNEYEISARGPSDFFFPATLTFAGGGGGLGV